MMHAGIMAAYKGETDNTVQMIVNAKTGDAIDEVFNRYAYQFEQAEHEANLYRFWLLLFAYSRYHQAANA